MSQRTGEIASPFEHADPGREGDDGASHAPAGLWAEMTLATSMRGAHLSVPLPRWRRRL